MFFELLMHPYRITVFCMSFIVHIPSKGIIVKLQIWLFEIEEREEM